MAARRRDRRAAAATAVSPPVPRVRMSGAERRRQLLDIARALFAERGFDATSIEEIAARGGVSKPIVYEHFGGKEGIYAVVVDREMQDLLDRMVAAISRNEHPKVLLERAALALLYYIDDSADGFRILVRDSPVGSASGTFSSLLNDIAGQVEHILGVQFDRQGYDAKLAALYSQALVGMVAFTGQWWLEARKPRREDVAAHLVNIAWNGLSHMEHKPKLDILAKENR